MERQEIPLATGRLQNFLGINTDAIEDDCQLVHQRNVVVALSVLDELGGFSHLDAAGRIDNSGYYARVHLSDALKCIWSVC